MPFDSTPIRTTTKARELAALLRDRSQWPEYFEWDYRACTMCAAGLAVRLGMAAFGATTTVSEDMSAAFAMSDADARKIFVAAQDAFGFAMSDVTSEHVAILLDRWCDAQEAV